MNTTTLKPPNGDRPTPWYKQAWPWFLIAIPFTAVIMGVVLIDLAITTKDGLVVDDYYWQGKHINQVLDRDHRATALNIDSVVSVDPTEHSIELRMISFAGDAPATMQLNFIHSTRMGFDQKIELTRSGPDQYVAKLPELAKGRWNLQLSADDWRVTGSLMVPDQRSARLSADR